MSIIGEIGVGVGGDGVETALDSSRGATGVSARTARAISARLSSSSLVLPIAQHTFHLNKGSRGPGTVSGLGEELSGSRAVEGIGEGSESCAITRRCPVSVQTSVTGPSSTCVVTPPE